MNIKIIAAILLIERLISAGFIIAVIRRQGRLLRVRVPEQLERFRQVLFGLSLVIFVGNFIPILIDTLTLFANLQGRPNPSAIGIAYALSNATTAVLSSVLVWVIYRLARSEE